MKLNYRCAEIKECHDSLYGPCYDYVFIRDYFNPARLLPYVTTITIRHSTPNEYKISEVVPLDIFILKDRGDGVTALLEK